MKEISKITNIDSAMYKRTLSYHQKQYKEVYNKCIKLRKIITKYWRHGSKSDKDFLAKLNQTMHTKFDTLSDAIFHYKVLKCNLRHRAALCKYLKSQFNNSQRLFNYKD